MSDIVVNLSGGSIIVTELNKGYSGVSGFSGRSGFSGANPGTSGVSGTSGKSGTSGRSGASGAGTSGTSGTSGRSGYSGISGTSGKSGTSGVSGFSGGGGAWASWTPTWTNLTVGNGTVDARYIQIGKAVFCRISIVFGTTTSVGGFIQFSLPVTSVAYAGTATVQPLGLGSMYDAGGLTYQGIITWTSITTAGIAVQNASATYLSSAATSATIPFAFGTADEINGEFFFEAA